MRSTVKISNVVRLLKNNGLVIIPTDTIYGFSCLPDSDVAIARLSQLKQRENKPYIILDTDEHRIKSYFKHVFTNKIIKKLIADKVWPGKLTVIADKCEKVYYPFLSKVNTIAIRYPDNELIRNLNSSLDSGIISTSINISGEKELTSISEIKEKWSDNVDYICEGSLESSSASLIIKINSEMKSIEIIRDPKTIESKEIILKLYKIVEKCR